MERLSALDYKELRANAEVVTADPFGDKVLLLEDGDYLKLFRVKRLWTSARLRSYAKRFANNIRRLADLDIPVPRVRALYLIPDIARTAVRYAPLPGKTLRDLGAEFDADMALKLGAFYKDLHGKGIYHRSLHLGNVVLTPERRLGLIDVADLNIYWGSLPRRLRLRNFQHLFRYDSDRAVIAKFANEFNEGLADNRVVDRILKMLSEPL